MVSTEPTEQVVETASIPDEHISAAPVEITPFKTAALEEITLSKTVEMTSYKTSGPVEITHRLEVFLHRHDASVSFTRPWADYKKGFGSPDTNYWMGLNSLHTLTSSKTYGLRVDMTGWDGRTLWAEYGRFSVGPESGNYKLKVGGYNTSSTVKDRIVYHNGMKFSTYDRDNDWDDDSCARKHKGGWWYNNCYMVNPTGLYLSGGKCNRNSNGIIWYPTPGYCRFYSLKDITFTLVAK